LVSVKTDSAILSTNALVDEACKYYNLRSLVIVYKCISVTLKYILLY